MGITDVRLKYSADVLYSAETDHGENTNMLNNGKELTAPEYRALNMIVSVTDPAACPAELPETKFLPNSRKAAEALMISSEPLPFPGILTPA